MGVDRIVKNTNFLIITNIFGMISNILVYSWIGKTLGPTQLGTFSFYLMFASLFFFVASLGIDQVLIREMARDLQKFQTYWRNALGMWLVQAAVVCLVVVLVGSMIRNGNYSHWGLFIAAGYTALEGVRQLFRAVFHSIERMEFETLATLGERGITLIGVFVVLRHGGDVITVLWVLLFSRLIGILSYYIFVYLYLHEKPLPAFNLTTWIVLGKTSIPFALNTFLSPFYTQADVVLVSILSGDQSAGFYRAATSLVYPLGAIASSLSNALFPVLSRTSRQGVIDINRRILQLMLTLSIPMVLGLVILSDRLIPLFYTSEFSVSINLLRILAIMLPFRFANNALGMILTSVDLQRLRTLGVGISSIIMVVLALFLIPVWGYYAAASVSVITEILITFLFVFYARNYLSFNTRIEDIIKLICANTILAFLLIILPMMNIFALIIFSAFVYLLFLLVVDCWGVREWRRNGLTITRGHKI